MKININEYAKKFSDNLCNTFRGEWIDNGQTFIGNANWKDLDVEHEITNVPCILKLLNTGVFVTSTNDIEVRVKYRITNSETDEVREDYCTLNELLDSDYIF